MKEMVTIEGYYQSISDFRAFPDQLLFTNKNGVIRWRNSRVLEDEEKRYDVLDSIDSVTLEPYYYRNPKIRREHVMIVQNVVGGDIDRAISVAYNWLKDNTNTLADTPILDNVNSISHIIYSVETGFSEEKVPRKTKESVSLIRYLDGKYGALLFFA